MTKNVLLTWGGVSSALIDKGVNDKEGESSGIKNQTLRLLFSEPILKGKKIQPGLMYSFPASRETQVTQELRQGQITKEDKSFFWP